MSTNPKYSELLNFSIFALNSRNRLQGDFFLKYLLLKLSKMSASPKHRELKLDGAIGHFAEPL